MKLKFMIAPYDGMLEAREGGVFYTIYQYDDKCVANWGSVSGEHGNILMGDLYECLDACNDHWRSRQLVQDVY